MGEMQIKNMCKEIYRDLFHETRKNRDKEMDQIILALIMRFYNTTEICWREVKFLWIRYLREGNLYFREALQMARERIADAEDIRRTEESLLAWLHSGV